MIDPRAIYIKKQLVSAGKKNVSIFKLADAQYYIQWEEIRENNCVEYPISSVIELSGMNRNIEHISHITIRFPAILYSSNITEKNVKYALDFISRAQSKKISGDLVHQEDHFIPHIRSYEILFWDAKMCSEYVIKITNTYYKLLYR
jgi:hypothetical protein